MRLPGLIAGAVAAELAWGVFPERVRSAASSGMASSPVRAKWAAESHPSWLPAQPL